MDQSTTRKRSHDEISRAHREPVDTRQSDPNSFGDAFSGASGTVDTQDVESVVVTSESGGPGRPSDGQARSSSSDEVQTTKEEIESPTDDVQAEQAFDPHAEVTTFDWSSFEARYVESMAEQDQLQASIHADFRTLMNMFGVWAQAAIVHENSRSRKRCVVHRSSVNVPLSPLTTLVDVRRRVRMLIFQDSLKTRMCYVQQAETSLIEKRDHYLKVVQAFESALALLAGPGVD